jgi:hypothetical protein
MFHTPSANALRHAHAVAAAAWLVMVPVSIVTGWVASIVFVSACSLYANFASHAAAWQASRAEAQAEV